MNLSSVAHYTMARAVDWPRVPSGGPAWGQLAKSDVKVRLIDIFGIDTRSLALFRVGLALLIITDLLLRARDLGAHYTDLGVLPREVLAAEVGSRMAWAPVLLKLNPHFLFGGAGGQAVLFVVAGLVAVLLLVGWRTRWVTIVSWVLLTSLHSRNPGVLNFGDVVFRLLLFWSMFLPLGARWSLDAAGNANRNRPLPDVVAGGATAAMLLQIGFVYAFNVVLKDGPAWTSDFTALEYALGNETWGNAVGLGLVAYPELLGVLTRLVIGIESCGLVIAFSPFWTGPARALAVVLFVGFHAGILLTMKIGIFAFVCMVAWLLFLPHWFWRRLDRKPGSEAPKDAAVLRLAGWQSTAALALVGYVLLWNVNSVGGFGGGMPSLFAAPGYLLRIDQRWAMFSPGPSEYTRFLAARGETAAGRSVDLMSGRFVDPMSEESARDPQAMARPGGRYDRLRWRMYLNYLVSRGARTELPDRLHVYLRRVWNAAHVADERLERVRLYSVYEPLVVSTGSGRPASCGGRSDRERRVREILSADAS